jgi:hypothetical protein
MRRRQGRADVRRLRTSNRCGGRRACCRPRECAQPTAPTKPSSVWRSMRVLTASRFSAAAAALAPPIPICAVCLGLPGALPVPAEPPSTAPIASLARMHRARDVDLRAQELLLSDLPRGYQFRIASGRAFGGIKARSDYWAGRRIRHHARAHGRGCGALHEGFADSARTATSTWIAGHAARRNVPSRISEQGKAPPRSSRIRERSALRVNDGNMEGACGAMPTCPSARKARPR